MGRRRRLRFRNLVDVRDRKLRHPVSGDRAFKVPRLNNRVNSNTLDARRAGQGDGAAEGAPPEIPGCPRRR